jgi:hypothetical protein
VTRSAGYAGGPFTERLGDPSFAASRHWGSAHHATVSEGAMLSLSSLSLVIQEGSGLTLREVIADIPHDGPAFVVYFLLVVFVAFIWHGSRKSKS